MAQVVVAREDCGSGNWLAEGGIDVLRSRRRARFPCGWFHIEWGDYVDVAVSRPTRKISKRS
ncbi:MAG: hypothetical protein OXB99_17975 [Acidimicrobiaceae bacterium]|nr:hypothetical protein [Acidimicrobiaceae bacterium]